MTTQMLTNYLIVVSAYAMAAQYKNFNDGGLTPQEQVWAGIASVLLVFVCMVLLGFALTTFQNLF